MFGVTTYTIVGSSIWKGRTGDGSAPMIDLDAVAEENGEKLDLNKHHRPEWYSLSTKERRHPTRVGSAFRSKARLLWACGFSRHLEPEEAFDGKVDNINT